MPTRYSHQHNFNPAEPTGSEPSAESAAPQKTGRTLKGRAIAYLSRREHSRRELGRKLQPYAEDAQQLSIVLDELEAGGWLSDERFAQSLVHRRAARQGSQRVLQELREHGIDEETVQQAQQSLQDTEYERAQAVWQRKFGAMPTTAKEYARQYRFLASRGFATGDVRRILGDIPYGSER